MIYRFILKEFSIRLALFVISIVMFFALPSCTQNAGSDDDTSIIDDDSGYSSTSTTTTSTTTTTMINDDDSIDDDSENSTTTTTTHTSTTTTTSTIITDDDSLDDDNTDDDSGDDDSGINYQPGDVVIGFVQGGDYPGAYIYVVSDNTKFNSSDQIETENHFINSKYPQRMTISITVVPEKIKDIKKEYLGHDTGYPIPGVDSYGNLHIIYFDSINHYIVDFTNSSGQWEKNNIIYVDNPDYLNYTLDNQNNGHICYTNNTSPYLQYATNISGEWIVEDIPDAEGYFPKLAVDSQGHAHISYLSDYTVYYATNASGAWEIQVVQIATQLPIPGWQTAPCDTAIAFDSNDNPHICNAICSIHGMFDTKGALYCGIQQNEGWEWDMSIVQFYFMSAPGSLSLLINKKDDLHLIYALYKINHTTNATGIFTTEIVSDSIGDDPAATLDQNDNIHIAFDIPGEGKLVYCTNASGTWTSRVVGGK